MMNDPVERTIVAIVAETFSVDPVTIDRSTVSEDVDGWDSLAHTILMLRLEKALHIRVDEELASTVNNVGELIDGIRGLCSLTRTSPD